jgi:hypothetical protein
VILPTRGRTESHSYGVVGIRLVSNVALRCTDATSTAANPDEVVEYFVHEARGAPALEGWRVLYEIPFAPGATEVFLTAARRADTLLVRAHGSADFMVAKHAARIDCHPMPGCPVESVEHLLLDQVLPRALCLRGRPCLHASAAAIDGRAVVLLGPAGSGKSTLCAALCRHGAELVCDDAASLERTGTGVVAYTGYPSIRLWPDSAAALLGKDHGLAQVTPRTDKVRLARPVAAPRVDVARLVLLEGAEPDSAPTLEDVPAAAAFPLLAPFVHRIDPEDSAAMEAEFELLTALCQHVRVSRLRFHQRFDQIDELVASIW